MEQKTNKYIATKAVTKNKKTTLNRKIMIKAMNMRKTKKTTTMKTMSSKKKKNK